MAARDKERYYWLKLHKDFFKRHDITVIEDMPNGKDYVLFYLKLMLESVDHEGALRFSDTIPYSETMLASVTHTNIDVVRSALKILRELGMVEVFDDKTLFMTEVAKLLDSETFAARRKREQRDSVPGDNVPLLSPDCPQEKEIEKDLEKEKKKEEENIDVCTAPETAAVLTLILNDGSEFPISQDYIGQMQELFPAVDVYQQMLKMKAWCINNQRKRKTRRGITTFINNWLSGEQDKAGRRTQQPIPQRETPAEEMQRRYQVAKDWANEQT